MIGWIFLIVMLAVELGMMGYSIVQKRNIKVERAYVRAAEFVIPVICLLPGILKLGFQTIGMYLVLLLFTIYSTVVIVKKAAGQEKAAKYTLGKTMVHTILMVLLLGFIWVPLILFPQHADLETSGQYESKVVTYTWTDDSRQETLSGKEEPRNVTVDLYYPDKCKDSTAIGNGEKFPLIVFSHGAFGYIKSNYSLFQELASNGYIVCSISHTYHAFFTEETSGKIKLVNTKFMQEVLDIDRENSYTMEEKQRILHEWLAVRTGDMNFVIDTIERMQREEQENPVFAHMDVSKIGLIGHSLGGSTSVAIARQRAEIGTAIVLDGTHTGERIGIKDGEYIYNEEPFNVPILDMRAQDHSESVKKDGYLYVNDHTVQLSPGGRTITLLGTGHMNFTDLPLFSPFLAKKLGTGVCDSLECTKQIDSIVLQWFNYYLKGASTLDLKDTYDLR